MNKNLFLILLIGSLSSPIFGQQIYSANLSTVGNEYDPLKYLTAGITSYQIGKPKRPRRRPNKKLKYYGSLDFSTSWYGLEITGLHCSSSFGKFVNSAIAVGVGTGLEIYATNTLSTYSFIPIFVELRGHHFRERVKDRRKKLRRYLFKNRMSPYYLLAVGAGIPTPLSKFIFEKGGSFKSGIFIKPALGVQFVNRRKPSFYLEMGLRIQKTNAEIEDWHFEPKTEERTFGILHQSITFRRLAFTFGWIF